MFGHGFQVQGQMMVQEGTTLRRTQGCGCAGSDLAAGTGQLIWLLPMYVKLAPKHFQSNQKILRVEQKNSERNTEYNATIMFFVMQGKKVQ